ncbi:hypothetical protein JTB14_004051 [Gonioctena quinquepunctata]|nr:hypothetical protein JTB14_004051 [Gonioctena quinquepunctata]
MPPKRKAVKSKEDAVPEVAEPETGAVDQFVDKKSRHKRAATKKDDDTPEEVVEKKRNKAASTKTKAEMKETIQAEPLEEEPKKSTRGKKAAAKAEEDMKTKKPARPVRGKKKEETSDANGVEETEKKVEKPSRKKKAEPEPTSEEPKPKGRKKAPKAEIDEPKKSAAASKTKPAAAKKGKAKAKVSEKEEKVPLNKTTTDWEKITFNCTNKNAEGMSHNLIISCWNVGGLKSWVKKDCLKFLEYETPDILCLQETKCSEDKLPQELKDLNLYKQYWCSSGKEGYAGVGLLTIKEPKSVKYGINVPELDEDGRCITAEYNEFFLVCVYVPNSGRKLVTLPKRLDWNEAFKSYIKDLDTRKPVIICGDMNVAHDEIDLARPQSNTKNAGFTLEEREGLTDFLGEGFIDTYRHFNPDKTDVYTFWTYMANARAKNVGWRLDYFIVSDRIMKKACDSIIRSEIVGSDHCPITLFININAEGPRAVSQ